MIDKKIAFYFLVISTVLSLIYCFLIPPFGLNDENRHYVKAYTYANGDVFDDSYIPMEVFKLASKHDRKQFLNPKIENYDLNSEDNFFKQIMQPEDVSGQLVKIKRNRSDLYSPTVYWPAIIAISISKKLGLNTILTFYLARLAILIVANFIIYYAIKNTPKFKTLFFLAALLPSILVNRSGVNADGLTFAYIFYFLSLIIKHQNEICDHKNKLNIFISATLVALSKTIYTPLILLFLITKPFKGSNFKNKLKLFIAYIIIPSLISLSWALAVKDDTAKQVIQFDEPYETGLGIGYNRIENIPEKQIEIIKQQPLKFAKVVISSLPYLALDLIKDFTQTLIFPRVKANALLGLVCFIILFLNNNQKIFSTTDKMLISSVNLILFLLVFLSVYIYWSIPQSTLIEGLQMRYFAINIFLLMLVMNFKIDDNRIIFTNCVSIMLFIVLNVSAIINAVEAYYIF